jgi:hypothetical protein
MQAEVNTSRSHPPSFLRSGNVIRSFMAWLVPLMSCLGLPGLGIKLSAAVVCASSRVETVELILFRHGSSLAADAKVRKSVREVTYELITCSFSVKGAPFLSAARPF